MRPKDPYRISYDAVRPESAPYVNVEDQDDYDDGVPSEEGESQLEESEEEESD